MNLAKIDESITEAERFLRLAREAKQRIQKDISDWNRRFPDEAMPLQDWNSTSSPETAATKRASMDLTRSLARLRRRKP